MFALNIPGIENKKGRARCALDFFQNFFFLLGALHRCKKLICSLIVFSFFFYSKNGCKNVYLSKLEAIRQVLFVHFF